VAELLMNNNFQECGKEPSWQYWKCYLGP